MLKIESMQQFQQYLAAVEGRIDHRAGRVKHTTLILAGIVAARAVPGTVQVRTYAGATKNVIWFQAAGGEFCLAYNHDEECVDVMHRNLQGQVIRQINDDDLGWIGDINDLFLNGDQHAQAA